MVQGATDGGRQDETRMVTGWGRLVQRAGEKAQMYLQPPPPLLPLNLLLLKRTHLRGQATATERCCHRLQPLPLPHEGGCCCCCP